MIPCSEKKMFVLIFSHFWSQQGRSEVIEIDGDKLEEGP